ncbi:hypothetical protein SteCoe_9232 [Stentor coeruleus]|uniref:Prolyl 4-hydroxylase alpha subunit domain-containing protein n=1 Tax=Stentor coeruleus TaxID=5963 RepID=A0A1R2CID5_9CILI|nr:hypothetical protein SteCoe_9232 [Stentor coeruleus]
MSDLILFDSIVPEVREIPNIKGAWLISNLLSQAECLNFIEKIQHDEIIDTSTRLREDDNYEASIIRKSKRYKHDLPQLSQQIFERLKGIAPETLTFESEDDELGPFLTGTWKFHSVNEKISFLKYEVGGQFSKHRDGIYIQHQDLRSLITVLVYLNSDYQEGRTSAYDDTGAYSISVEPIIGSAFMMIQRVLHEGGQVASGVKLAVRFDLMYHREGEMNSEIEEKNKLAAEYLKMANELERSHQGLEAVKYYRMAFKLNPQLESIL